MAKTENNSAEESNNAAKALSRAYEFAKEGDFFRAQFECEIAINLATDWAEPHNLLGIILEGNGKFNDAEAAYRKALEIDPEYEEAKQNLKELSNAVKHDPLELALGLPTYFLIITISSLLGLVAFILPWWSFGRTSISGLQRALGTVNPGIIIIDDELAFVMHPPAPILNGIIFISILCIILVLLIRFKLALSSRLPSALIFVLSVINIAILLIVLVDDQTPALVENVELPLFWNTTYGLYLTVLANVGIGIGGLVAFRRNPGISNKNEYLTQDTEE